MTSELPEEAREYLGDASPLSGTPEGFLERIRGAAREKLAAALSSSLKTAGVLLIVCTLTSLSDTLEAPGANSPVTFAGVAAIGATALSDFDSCLSLGLNSLYAVSDYSKALLPALASAAACTGGAGGAAARYAAAAMFMDLLLECTKSIIAPGVCALAALSVADAAVGNHSLKAAKKLVKTVCGMMLTGLSLAFTGYLSVSGVVAETADAAAARMMKTAVSTALPVVGGILSDAAGSLAAAAGSLRAGIGLFGMAAAACLCLGPFCSLGVRYLTFKISAGLCGCVADKRFTTLVEDLGTCFGMLLGINGAGALMMFISIYSLIRTAL